jgi:hypothetical protein
VKRRRQEIAVPVLDHETGQLLKYRALLCHPRFKDGWNLLGANEFDRLSQGKLDVLRVQILSSLSARRTYRKTLSSTSHTSNSCRFPSFSYWRGRKHVHVSSTLLVHRVDQSTWWLVVGSAEVAPLRDMLNLNFKMYLLATFIFGSVEAHRN